MRGRAGVLRRAAMDTTLASPCLLLEILPAEALEAIVSCLDPADVIASGGWEPQTRGQAHRSTLPLAATCSRLHALVSTDAIGRAITRRSEGADFVRVIYAAMPHLPGTSLLRIAAARQRHRGYSGGEGTVVIPRQGFTPPEYLPDTTLPLQCICASTTDHHFESIEQTLQAPLRRRHPQFRGHYWSSTAQTADSDEYLVYRLPGMCSIDEVRICSYEEGPTAMCPTFTWERVQVTLTAHLPCADDIAVATDRGDGEDKDGPQSEAVAMFRTEELPAFDTLHYQSVLLAQQPGQAIGRYLIIALNGKRRKQHEDTGWFICVDHVEVRGRRLLGGMCLYPLVGTLATPLRNRRLGGGGLCDASLAAVCTRQLRTALHHKDTGNGFFKAHHLLEAVGSYSRAIDTLLQLTDDDAPVVVNDAEVEPAASSATAGAEAEELLVTLLSNRAECALRVANEAVKACPARAGAWPTATRCSTSMSTDPGYLPEMAADGGLADALLMVLRDTNAALDRDPTGRLVDTTGVFGKTRRRLDRACAALAQVQSVRAGGEIEPMTRAQVLQAAMPVGPAHVAAIQTALTGTRITSTVGATSEQAEVTAAAAAAAQGEGDRGRTGIWAQEAITLPDARCVEVTSEGVPSRPAVANAVSAVGGGGSNHTSEALPMAQWFN